MATRRKRIPGHTYKRNGKKITVKSYLRNIPSNVSNKQQARKKSHPQVRTEKTIRNDRAGKSKRTSSRQKGRVSKPVKIPVPSKPHSVRGRKSKTGKRVSETQITVRHPRSKQEIDIVFRRAKSFDSAMAYISGSEKSQTEIERQLARRESRPPLGVLVLIECRAKLNVDGKIKTIDVIRGFLSTPEMVINLKNVISFIIKSLKDLKKESEVKARVTNNGNELQEDDSEGVLISVKGINIKFFYGK